MSTVTRHHRILAVNAMYPGCDTDNPMWRDFVEKGDAASYRTLARVAQMVADLQPDHGLLRKDLDLIHSALFSGQISSAKVDAQRALMRLIEELGITL